MRRFALRTGAGTGARPGTVPRGHTRTQVIVLEADACSGGAELIAGLGLSCQSRRCWGTFGVWGAAGRVVPVVLKLSYSAVERAALAHPSLLTRSLFGYLLLGRLGADQDYLQPQWTGPSVLAPHSFVGFNSSLHFLELHDGTFLSAQLSVAAAQPLQVGRQVLPGLQNSDGGNGAVRPERFQQQLHQLLLLRGSSLTASVILGESSQLRPPLQITQQQHAARQRLTGKDRHCRFTPHLPTLIVQLEYLRVSQSMGGGPPVTSQVFHLQRDDACVKWVRCRVVNEGHLITNRSRNRSTSLASFQESWTFSLKRAEEQLQVHSAEEDKDLHWLFIQLV